MGPSQPVILLIGTMDTKSDELLYLRERMTAAGAGVLVMDVGVLEPARFHPDISNEEVAAAGGVPLATVRGCGDENQAMTIMAGGASALAARLHGEGMVDGMLALGGSMGTDLALDVATALPLGCPKVLLSTIAHSPLIAPQRITPDLIMMLWSGGLYGLNSLCRAALSQAAGAVVGACQNVEQSLIERPMVGITSFGKSCLRYMVTLKPALEARGYEVAVFHTTGMGGRAYESLAGQGRFCAVFDFSLQELSNHLGGSCVSAGPDRLMGAGRAGVPQLVAPGAVDMIDYPAWGDPPDGLSGRPIHVHNRLIASSSLGPPMRRRVAQEIGRRLAMANGPTCLLVPMQGLHAWDSEGQPLHDRQGLEAFVAEMRRQTSPKTEYREIDAHINDEAFAWAALEVFDGWVRAGKVVPGWPVAAAAGATVTQRMCR
jgi:uncharacterized protein (UPF0261 family)